MWQNICPSSDWHTNSTTALRRLHVLRSHTEYTHTVSFITPQGAILCTAEIWWLPSLINVQAAPINIFISAYAPCWKPIQGDFKLYELIPYLLRQLSMPTPSLNTSFLPPSSSPVLISSLPPPPPQVSPHCRNGIWAFGVHAAGNESWGLKVSVPFQSF